jgi:uncharacterized protein YaaN involved in tellurite resistance
LNISEKKGQELAADSASELALPEIDSVTYDDLSKQAKEYIDSLSNIKVKSPAFMAKIKRIDNLGNADMIRIGAGSKRLLDRSMNGSNMDDKNSQEYVNAALDDLSNIVDRLAPTHKNLNMKNFLGIFPRKEALNAYFSKYNDSQDSINVVIKSLLKSKDELIKDNASLEQEQQDLWGILNNLQEYSLLIDILETKTLDKIVEEKALGNTNIVKALESEILYAILQKKQDILIRTGVGIQAYLSMDLIRDTNKELAKGVDRARTTTITALRTAVMIAQSLSNQQILLDKIDVIMRSTENTVKKASYAMNKEAVTINMANGLTDKNEAVLQLQAAFSNISNALASIKDVKDEAATQMSRAITGLSYEVKEGQEKISTLINEQNYGSENK